MIIRRHPDRDYLVDIIGSGAQAIGAHAVLGMANLELSKRADEPSKEFFADRALTLEQCRHVVTVLRQMKLLVDDRVLVVDARMNQWQTVLGVLIFPGGLVAAFLTERSPEAWSWVSSGFLLLLGVLIGGSLYRMYERDGASLPSPLAVARYAAVPILWLLGLALCFVVASWVHRNVGGWAAALLMFVVLPVVYVVVGITVAERRRKRVTTKQAQQT